MNVSKSYCEHLTMCRLTMPHWILKPIFMNLRPPTIRIYWKLKLLLEKHECIVIIFKNTSNKKFLIATPTNQLKIEVAERLRALNVPVLESLSVSELEYISPRLKKKILKLYDNGYSSIARKSIKKSLRKECQKSSENYDNITRDDVC